MLELYHRGSIIKSNEKRNKKEQRNRDSKDS